MEPTALLPFIPGGADFAKSRELFGELGFQVKWDVGVYVGYQLGGAKFILQDFNEPTFASLLMMRLEVPDLNLWWRETELKRLPERFPGFRINPPEDFPWGSWVNFIDLAGVCWHVGKG